jgi:geranylgeranyl pyrophosphate synthase
MEPLTATFFDLVRSDMPEVETRMRSHPGSHHPSLDTAIDLLLASGGKRIRPTVVLLCGGMLGADRDRLLTLASAIELLHTATLVHDDLIDEATLRRGIPTLNSQWTPGATVLTGDYIFARAANLAAQTDSLQIMARFAETLMTIVNGEITQLFGTRSDDNRKDYYDRIYAKTASLFELAAEGGALLAEVEPNIADDVRQFGYSIGVAFQIVDDVLDFVGDPAKVGKPLASDLRHGLMTLPTLYYHEQVPNDLVLQRLIHQERIDDEEMDRLVESIRSSDAVERARREARAFIDEAETLLTGMPPSRERDALSDLARYVVQRSL